MINYVKLTKLNKRALINKVQNKTLKSVVIDGIKSILYVTADEVYRYPRIGDPSRNIGIKLTDEEINSIK